MKSALTIITFTFITARFSSQAPTAPSAREREAPTTSGGPTSANSPVPHRLPYAKSYLDDKDAHPTLKAFSALSRIGYTKAHHDGKKQLFETDPLLLAAAKVDKPQDYVAAFNDLMPGRDRSTRDQASMNFSVTSLMNAHMQHIGKDDAFQALVKSHRARQSQDKADIAKRRRLAAKAAASGGVYVPGTRIQHDYAQTIRAATVKRDMKQHNVEWSDDPVKFEKNARVLLDVHGHRHATKKLTDYMRGAGKDQEFIDQVRNLRLKHMCEKYMMTRNPPKRKRRSNVSSARARSSKSHEPTPDAVQGASSSHIQQSPQQHLATSSSRPRSPMRDQAGLSITTPPASPAFSAAIDALSFHEDSHPSLHHLAPPTNVQQHSAATSQFTDPSLMDDAAF